MSNVQQAPQQDVPPPRAFTQGVGLVFQVVGVLMFLAMMFVCCGSSLLNKDFATQSDLTRLAWHGYSAQRALSIALFVGVFFGVALAGIGLGLQSENRAAPILAIGLTAVATVFWLIHLLVAAQAAGSILFSIIAAALMAIFALLLALAIGAAREMRRNPPPRGQEILPGDYKIPYSHYHADPPEVRLAAELEQRRQRLAVQQKELELLEEKLKKKMDERPEK